MAASLRGALYAHGVDASFKHIVHKVLPFLSFETACELYRDLVFGNAKAGMKRMTKGEVAYLGACDRFFLLAHKLNRKDANNEWCYDRCREVEADPDEHLDLWARYHYKSTIITFAGSIQEIINDPDITIGIFSNTGSIAQKFLGQIKRELETNEELKDLYPDVFYARPEKESPLWSAIGITVKRKGNPKEATVEAHGLIAGLPTSRHFMLMIFNDVVTHESVTQTNTDQIGKTTVMWELAQNLTTHTGGRRWHEGTRYHFADTYGVLMERKVLKLREYPATDDGTMNGNPVFLTPEAWAKIKNEQRSTVAAQMLLNPLAGSENTFILTWLRPYELRPRLLNVYIIVDPSKGKTKKSDRTAMVVIGVDSNLNRYLLDGYCHRMKLSQRKQFLKDLHRKWKNAPGVQDVRIGYETYGLQTDNESIEEDIIREKIEGMNIEEVNWVREGPQSKNNRIERLEPYFRNSQFWMPPKIWAIPAEGGKACECFWRPAEDASKIEYWKVEGQTKAERGALKAGERYRLMEPLRRVDEDGNIYDLTRVFFEEFRLQPFAPHEDLLDATSRIQDMEPTAPIVIEKALLESPGYRDS